MNKPAMQRPMVLVVEDDPMIMLGAVQMFEAAGAEALVAFTADEALKHLQIRNDIQLVFTDCMMPGDLDGLQLAQIIRNRWPTIEIIVVSGAVDVEQHTLPLGCRFFSKPVQQVQVSHTLIELGLVGNVPKALYNFPSKNVG
jgi:CheY-like chemotaxis protein